jgi:hypothetical protein
MRNFIDKEDLLSFIQNNPTGFVVEYPPEVTLEPELQVKVTLSDFYEFFVMVTKF